MHRMMRTRQQGVSLIEALVAILIFSLGILGLIALQGRALTLSADAKHRADAAFLANQLLGEIAVADQSVLTVYRHQPSGVACAPEGTAAASNSLVDNWLQQVSATLPNASAGKQQVIVDAANRTVEVSLCWEVNNGDPHFHTVSTQLPPQ